MLGSNVSGSASVSKIVLALMSSHDENERIDSQERNLFKTSE